MTATLTITLIILGSCILIGVITLISLVTASLRGGSKLHQLVAENERLTAETEQLKFQKDQLGKEIIKIKEKLNILTNEKINQTAKLEATLGKERDDKVELQKKVNQYENEQSQRDAETDRKLNELSESRRTLEKERERVIADEKKKQQELEENRNRIWNDHEREAILAMNEICKKQELLFTTYDNTNLPDEFDSKFKPDFMIRFLDQYIIFDAKHSTSDLSNYIKGQVTKTIEKIKNSSAVNEIYKTVFFIVPTIDLEQLKSFNYYENGYRFFIIPIEAFEPILASFKRLESYDLAEKYDPQERENVINLIASFDHHIRKQGAVNIINSLEGLKVLGERKNLPADIIDALELRLKEQSIKGFTPTVLSPYIKDPLRQIEEIKKLVEIHQPDITPSDLADGLNQSIAASSQNKNTKKKKEGSQEFDFD